MTVVPKERRTIEVEAQIIVMYTTGQHYSNIPSRKIQIKKTKLPSLISYQSLEVGDSIKVFFTINIQMTLGEIF